MSGKKSKFSAAERRAYNFGKGYAAGKSGTMVPFGEKNKRSFQAGYAAGQKLVPKYENASQKKGN